MIFDGNENREPEVLRFSRWKGHFARNFNKYAMTVSAAFTVAGVVFACHNDVNGGGQVITSLSVTGSMISSAVFNACAIFGALNVDDCDALELDNGDGESESDYVAIAPVNVTPSPMGTL